MCKWVTATEEFPEDVLRVAECEVFVEMISIVIPAFCNKYLLSH